MKSPVWRSLIQRLGIDLVTRPMNCYRNLTNCRDNGHMNKWKRLDECLFRLFDPWDSPMEEEIRTTGPTDFEEILILLRRIGLWKSNSVPKTSRSLNTFRHHAARISASISIFDSVAHPLNFPFGMGGTVQ